MYNRIIGLFGQSSGSHEMTSSRMLEWTSKETEAFIKKSGSINFDYPASLPRLFMEEGTSDEIARVGTISNITSNGREVSFDYSFTADIPPIFNSTIEANAREFGIREAFEFSRTHWAVKDVNLYRAVLKTLTPVRSRPVVFQLPEAESIDRKLVSAMMPFDPRFTPVYQAIKDVAGALKLRVERADEIWNDHAIIADIVSLIDRSKIVIADCTSRNPNVFYEVGIAHTLGREVILITQSMDDIPFDLRHLRCLTYLNNGEGLEAMKGGLQRRMETVLER